MSPDCPPNPAYAGKASFDFTTANKDNVLDFWSTDEETSQDEKRLDFETDGKGVAMGMWNQGQAPTLISTKYLLFGKVSVTLQAARGRGLITAVVLKSNSGDEIDWVSMPTRASEKQSLLTMTGTPGRVRQPGADQLLS